MIVAAMLARNEAAPDRYLERTLRNLTDLCDAVVVVDDGSTDDTPDICEHYGADVIRLDSEGWWGNDEQPARARLWDEAAKRAGTGFIYFADADHELVGCDRAAMQALSRAENVNAWAWPLWDCWDSEDLMRTDGMWQAHNHPRPWMVRAKPHDLFRPDWSRSGLHVGHVPSNFPYNVGLAPGGIRHLGYVKREHREAKAKKYLATCGGGATLNSQ